MSSQRPREPIAEPPYTGSLGGTRREHAFVTGPDGAARRVELVRQVNTLTDPLLARQCLDGTLHRVGELDLAVSYVFHDPTARRFVLVVPAPRAHEELTLRAELLAKLAGDAGESLPGYVREARVAVGVAGLRRYLEESARGGGTSAPDPRAEALAKALEQREEKLHRLAQEVTRREDELAAAQNDLAGREADLDRRMADVVAREEALADEERVMRANMAALTSREARIHAREESLRPSVVDELEPTPDDAPTRRPASIDEPEDGSRHSREIALEDRMEVDVLDLTPGATGELPAGGAAAREDEQRTRVAKALALMASVVDDPTPPPAAPEDRARWAARGDRAYVAVVEGEVRVWFQGTSEIASQLAGGAVVPVLQADPDGALPVALLTLRAESGTPVYTRVPLDITRPEDRAVVESLARDFRVRAEVVSALGRALGSTALGAPCEQNASRVLETLTARPAAPADDHLAAMERLRTEGLTLSPELSAAVPLADEHALTSAAGVASALEAVAPLLDRARLDRFIVARGVSLSQVESFTKRLGLAALRCGVVPSADFIRRALELTVAPDERALATRALTAFARTCEGGVASIGLTPATASRAWAPLLAWASRVGVNVPEAARAAIASLYDPDDPTSVAPPDTRAAPPPESYATMMDSELATWIDHPDARLPAARELAKRDASRHEAVIGRALRMLPSARVAALAADLVRGGDALGDVWVELLGSRRRVVAAVATAGAGVLKLRRALTPLVQRCFVRDNADWRLAAWAVGEFGVAAVRAVARTDTADIERLAWVLGFAIRNGAAKEVERARAEGSKVFGEAATRSLALQDELKAWDEALRRGDGELGAMVQPVITRGHGAEEPRPRDGAA